jgi:hypothetical protein
MHQQPTLNIMFLAAAAAAVSNGAGRVLLMIVVPEPRPGGPVTLRLRDDGKAVISDSSGNCLASWGYGINIIAGC